MLDAFGIASSRPWLITPDALQTVLNVAERMGDPEALATKMGRPLDNTRTVENRNGTAVVPITGPIFRYANLMTNISGATSTQVLATDIQTALDDPAVKAIVLNIDSPGGEASGIGELAQMIYEGRSKKPITAYIGGSGASAAYWIASAASKIVVDQTAILGSIGVVMSHVNTSQRDAKAGVKRYEIVSSASPNKRLDPGSDAGREASQRVVNDLANVFVSAIARNRGTTTKTVQEAYGRGGVMVGSKAVAAGMADKIGSLESTIASATQPSRSTPAMATATPAPLRTSAPRVKAEDHDPAVRAMAAKMIADYEKKKIQASWATAFARFSTGKEAGTKPPVPASWKASIERTIANLPSYMKGAA